MFRTAQGWFRDFSCFAAFLVLFSSLVESGYGQQPAARPTPPTKAPDPLTSRAAANADPVAMAAARVAGISGTQQPAVSQPPAPKSPKLTAGSVRPHFAGNVDAVADPTDPYIVNQARALNNDPNQIFAFVRDQIGFEVYAGSLRGSRGTLFSKAGNSLDRASLLIALLGAAGVSARYVQGSLTEAQKQQLIGSMFTSPSRVSGCVPLNVARANPLADPQLLSDTGTHYWVEFGSGFTPADTSFKNAQVGQVFGTPSQRFTTIPAALETTITFRLDVEEYSQAGALFGFGGGLGTTEVLNQTLNAAELAGSPVTVGHFVSSNQLASILSSTTHTYSPYLRYSVNPSDTTDVVLRGQDYQETYTNFPLGTQILTGVFLNIDVTSPGGQKQTYQHTMLDRLGPAARQGLATVSVSTPANLAPALTEMDLITVNAISGLQDTSVLSVYQTQGAAMDAGNAALHTKVGAVSFSNPSAADQTAMQQAIEAERETLVLMARAGVSSFAATSDAQNAKLATKYLVKPYYNSPRLILYSSGVQTAANNTQSLVLGFDLLKNDMRVVAPPGQAANAPFDFNIVRGLADNAAEEAVAKQLTSQLPAVNTVGILDILQAAQAQGVALVPISSATVGSLDPLTISANAKALITAAVGQGHVVLVPASPVTVNGQSVIGWIDHDPVSGYTTGASESGAHDLTGYAGLLLAVVQFAVSTIWIIVQATAFILGFAFGAVLATTILLPSNPLAGITSLSAILAVIVSYLYVLVESFPVPIGLIFLTGLIAGATAAFVLISLGNLSVNPVVTTSSVKGPIRPEAPASANVLPFASDLGAASGGTPGSSPGVSLSLAVDGPLTLPFDGLQLPLVYSALIHNTGPAADQYSLNVTPPSGYSLEASLTSVTVPAGQTGEIDFCLVPTGTLPAPGTTSTVNATVAGTSSNANGSAGVTAPTVQAVTLSAAPSTLAATPGNSATTTLTVQAVGNAAVTTNFTKSAPAGVTVSGLTGPVTLSPGQTTTETLTLTAAAGAPLGSQLPVLISSTVGDPQNPSNTSIAFTVTSAQAQAAVAGAQNAANLGRTDIATTLGGLSGAINSALASCSAGAQALVLDYLGNLIQEMNAPFLQSFTSQLQAAQTAISSATCANIGAALTTLSNTLASLNTALSSPAAFPFNITLLPNTAVAQPNQATQFLVILQNNATTTNTYTLSLGTLPSGVTGSLNLTSVTLAPGASTSGPGGPVATLTPSTSTGGSFSVTASIDGVSGSAQTASGTLTARSEFLHVQEVKATPGFVASGGSVDVTASLANVVNTSRSVQVALTVLNSSNATVLTPPAQTATLSVQTLLTTVDFGQVSTQGLANGTYTLSVTVKDPSTGQTLPGGTGSGVLLVGSPVTASLTLSPTTLAPGNGKVTTTLTVTSNNVNNGGAPFSLLGSAALASGANTIALNGNTAYSCDQNEVSIVDVTDPTNPKLIGTALAGAITNAANIFCSIQRGDLVMLADAGSTLTGNQPSFLAFDLTNPLAPSLIKSTLVNKRFFGNPFYQGNFAFFGTLSVSFFSGSGTVVDQFGDFVSLNVADFTNPFVTGTLEQPQRDPVTGGAFGTFGVTQGPGQIAYLGATTSTGGNTAQGNGQLWAVDISDPTHLSFIKQVDLPGTRQTEAPFVQGNLAVTVSNTLGWRNPGFGNGQPAQTGNLVITVFDITDPRNPQILSNTTTALIPGLGFPTGAIIGTNLFLVNGQEDAGGNAILFTIDTTDPHNPVIKTFPVPATINSLVARGNILYAATADHGLQTYSIPGTGAIQYTATIQAAKSGGVAYDATSFSTPPTTITPGSTFDTLTWVNPPSNTITFSSNVTGIQAGQVLPVDLGGSVSFTSNQGPGTDALPPLNVNSAQILGINPATQTVAPGGVATYTLTVSNPTSAAVTYNLSVAGVPSRWVTLPSTVNVPAGGSTNVTLALGTAFADVASTNGFQVTASVGGVSGAVSGTLIIQGTPNIGTPVSTSAIGVAVTLTPTTATGGRGTNATYVVQVTNAGAATDTYTLSATLPAGVTGTFDQTSLQVPAGLSNFRQVNLRLKASAGTAPGALAFTVKATSSANSTVTGQASGTLNVSSAGVTLAFNPATTAPGGTLQLTVTNTGTAADTFDLVLGGAAGISAQAAVNSVTLGAGASQNVAVTVGAVPAPPGNVSLFAIATSRANTSVTGAAQATIAVPSSNGVSAVFSPSTLGLSAPGPATFLLELQNTGNVEDSYSATITGTTGPITASLLDLTGNPTQSIPLFRLPGLALGQLTLNTTLTGNATGTVTVKITSTSNSAVTATATATLQIGAVSGPVSNAGKNRNVPTGRYAMLDGSGSFDPAGNRIGYAWSLVAAPVGSQLATPVPPGSVRPDFLPDVDGVYKFQLVVSNSTQSSAPGTVQFTAVTGNVPPNADAGKPQNGVVSKSVVLDGSASFDPDQGPQPLAYLWQVQQAPAASAVGSKSIANATQSKASFVPDMAGAYTISLQVFDGTAFNTDTVTVTVAAADAPPNAIAGPDRRVLPGTLVALDGSASSDPDGQALSFQWGFASGALDNLALQGAATAKPSFTPIATGFYVARLTVNDGVASSDNVTVLATSACDANGDGLVNQVDFDLMTAISGQAAQAGDPLDVTGDGVIDAKDIAACQVTTVPQLPTISVDKTTLVFNYVQGDPAPPAQTLTVTGGGAVIAFQVSTNGTPWLAVNPSSANTNATVQVTLDPSKLPVGNYAAPLTILAQRANPGQTQVTVVVHVLEPPRLTLTPAVLSFQWLQGAKLPAAQVVNVGSVTRNLPFTATASNSWIAITPASGQTITPVSVAVVNLDQFVAGSYKGTVTFAATNGAPQVVQVNLIVFPAPPVVTAAGVTNAASGLSGPIAPGELVNVTGLYFGPAQLVKQQGTGVVATSLSDTEVMFEGVPAPILQVANGQVEAVVPFFLDGKTTAAMQVVYQGVVSSTVQLAVAKAMPGVFTADASGKGQALATNADGTANSPGNAAARGSKLSIYLTGGGVLNPPGFDGRIAAVPLAALVQQAAVQIGGQAAPVTLAGDDAGQVEGYVKVDVTVPQGIDPGNAALVVTIGGAGSQAGVTVAVR